MGNIDIIFWGKLYAKRFLYKIKNIKKYYYFKGTISPIPIFVIGTPRCGSSLLESYLSKLPNTKVRGEILNPWLYMGMRRNCSVKKRVMRHIRYTLYSVDAMVCVAKLLNEHLERYNIFVKDLIKEFPPAKFIVIYRKKLGEQYYSLLKAKITQQWFEKNEETKDIKKINVNADDFVRYCFNIKEFYEKLIAQLDKYDNITIAYEELKANGQTIIDHKIAPFIGVNSVKISTKLKKQNLKSLPDVIENYQNVKHLLKREIAL
jgi:hypothetical protein